MRAMPRYLLSLGSNVGNREANLAEAIERLESLDLKIETVSSLYETEPVGEAAGPDWFLNAAAAGETDRSAADLLGAFKTVERLMGRGATVPGGPRNIDIDLLYFGDWIVQAEDCEVPHPRLHERRFVLEPLAEIAAGARDPRDGRSVAELLAAVPDTGKVVRKDGFRLTRS